MNLNFKVFKYKVKINVGFSYWANEPTPLKASWEFSIDIDLNNDKKIQYNYDLTKVLTPEMMGCWVAFGPLHKSVVDYDLELSELSKRIGDKKVTYWRYNTSDYHFH